MCCKKVAGIVKVWIPYFEASKWNHSKGVFVMESFELNSAMLRMVRGIHCNDPCAGRDINFFGWADMLVLQREEIKAIKLANHLLTEFLIVDEVKVLMVNPCCFQNVS